MKRLFFTLLLFVSTASIFAQTTDQPIKVDTVINQKWNGTVYEDTSKIISTYDGSCKLTKFLIQFWNTATSSWQNSALTTYTYGSNGLVSIALLQTWNPLTSTWDDAIRLTYTYDVSNRIDYYTTENNLFGTWTLFSKSTYSYNTSNNVDSILTQITYFGPLQNSALSLFTYNADNTLKTEVSQIWSGTAWVNASRITNTYDVTPRLISTLIELWQVNAWVNFEKSTPTYDGSGHVSVVVSQKWNGSTWVNDSRSNYYYTTSCTTLPLHLISFTATKDKSIVNLNWQTAEELNTSHFNIQRSSDGTNFSNVGKVSAAGSGNHTYSFADNIQNITGDKVYYRLQMTDKDGKFTYSKILPLTLQLFTGNIKIYPNPVKDQLYILYNAQNSTKATVRIADATGKIVHTEVVSLSNGAIGINVSGLAKGVYYVQLITDKGTERTNFVKQ